MKRYNLFFILILFAGNFCVAGTVRGFVVTTTSDTLWGLVQVSHFNQVTGALVIGGIETESFFSRVVFRGDNQSGFETYFPENLKAFGFAYEDVLFFFESKAVERKSIFKSERSRLRFVRVLCDDRMNTIYKELYYLPNPSLDSNFEHFIRYDTYYRQESGRIKKNN